MDDSIFISVHFFSKVFFIVLSLGLCRHAVPYFYPKMDLL